MIYDLMRTRRSIRNFRPETPPRAVLERLLAAAVTAPSASNKQPWRFLVVTDAGVIRALAAAVREAVLRIGEHVESGLREPFLAYGDYFTRFESAPVVIVPLCRRLAVLSNLVGETLPREDRERIDRMEDRSGLVSTSLALQNILLVAHEAGLGASAMTGPLVASDRVGDILGVPASWEVVAFVPVGFPAESPDAPPRKPFESVTRWI